MQNERAAGRLRRLCAVSLSCRTKQRGCTAAAAPNAAWAQCAAAQPSRLSSPARERQGSLRGGTARLPRLAPLCASLASAAVVRVAAAAAFCLWSTPWPRVAPRLDLSFSPPPPLPAIFSPSVSCCLTRDLLLAWGCNSRAPGPRSLSATGLVAQEAGRQQQRADSRPCGCDDVIRLRCHGSRVVVRFAVRRCVLDCRELRLRTTHLSSGVSRLRV